MDPVAPQETQITREDVYQFIGFIFYLICIFIGLRFPTISIPILLVLAFLWIWARKKGLLWYLARSAAATVLIYAVLMIVYYVFSKI